MSGAELIRSAASAADVAAARALFEEYAAALDVDLCFQGFAQELASLPGAYAPPRGRLLLAGAPSAPIGCVALRPLPADGARLQRARSSGCTCDPPRAARGLGAALARAILAEARAIGYREARLDTLASMTAAQALYASLGFRECAAYYHNPLGGTVYMALAL